MRFLAAAIGLSLLATICQTQEQRTSQPQQAPKVILKSPDGKKAYDLAQLVEKGPVLVRFTCACTGCDAEVDFFQKLQEA